MFSSNTASVPLVANIDGNGNNGFLGGDGLWGLIIILALLGWGNGGFGGFGGNGANAPWATQADVRAAVDQQTLISKIDQQTYGMADSFTALNNTLNNNFRGIDNAVCNLGFNVQQGFNTTNVALMQAQNALQTQLANCCCENREGQAQIRYDMATQACDTRQTVQNSARDIIDNANANNRAILDFLVNDKIATLTAENQSLKFAASQTAQNQFITQVGSDIVNRLQPVPVPAFPASNLYAYGNGSGCNSCC